MRYSILAGLTLAAVSLAACQQKPVAEAAARPSLESVLPNIPMPPGGMALTTENSKDAMQFVFASPVAVDSMLTFYRDVLGKAPYRLINEATTGGVTSFYVEQEGPSMWVAVQKNGESGSMITIAGATSDTTARKAAAPGDSTRPKPAS